MDNHDSNNSDSVDYRSRGLLGYLFAFISAALFGSISTVAKPALSGTLHPLLLSSMVYLVAALVMTPIAYKKSSNNSRNSNENIAFLLKRKNYLYIV